MMNIARLGIGGRVALCLLATVGFVASAQTAGATIHTITDLNTTVEVDDSSQSGVSSWEVDGTDHLFQQWFWYRIGDSGGESSIDTLSLGSAVLAGQLLTLTYEGSGFEIDVFLLVVGGTAGSGFSDIAETIRIRNTSDDPDPLEFHFFQYSDFDLCGTADNDTVQLIGAGFNTANQQDPACSGLSETVHTLPASHHAADFFADIRNSLNDGSPTTLDDSTGPLTGDATWAYQWDFSIGPGGSVIISKDKQLRPIPEPTTLTLIGAGLLGLALRRRRRP